MVEADKDNSSIEMKSDNGFLPVEKLASLFKDNRQNILPPKKRKRNQNSDELTKTKQRRKKLKEEVPAGKPTFVEHKSKKDVKVFQHYMVIMESNRLTFSLLIY